MPTIEVYEADKARLKAMRRETPGRDRTHESIASVVKRLLDAADIPAPAKEEPKEENV